MNDSSIGDVIREFKTFRRDQKARIDHVMSFTPAIEDLFAQVSAAIGNDPVKNEPIARVTRQMPDFQRRWAVTLSPIYGPGLSLFVDAGGTFKLQDDSGEAIIEDIAPNARGFTLFKAANAASPGGQVDLEAHLLTFVARQLRKAMNEGATFS